jgi:hypothetical protein
MIECLPSMFEALVLSLVLKKQYKLPISTLKCSALLIIRMMQIKNIMRYHIDTTMVFIKKMKDNKC